VIFQEEYGYAIDDASKAIELDPKYMKAYYRRGLCHLSVLKYQKAIEDFRTSLKLDPKNAIAKSQLEATQKLVRRIEFEKAIEVEEDQSPVEKVEETISDGGCGVPNDYDGPKLPPPRDSDKARGGKYGISREFIDEMTVWFKKGKTLAKRVVWEIVLGVWSVCVQEESMTGVLLEEGMTCDVIGDTHGQYYDLLHLLELTGTPTLSPFRRGLTSAQAHHRKSTAFYSMVILWTEDHGLLKSSLLSLPGNGSFLSESS